MINQETQENYERNFEFDKSLRGLRLHHFFHLKRNGFTTVRVDTQLCGIISHSKVGYWNVQKVFVGSRVHYNVLLQWN